ncbi:EcsC family protein [Paraburkholderia caballeronis]|uniref:EcsC family protein n=1 Tax=Paraburkholderia caballeronis TaxID=416943 RepID=UPI001064CF03|nr:EcsC family protein [Paraburkholderia caballeronis]TDV16310.1 EcsC family protein [Paraburkholderia caballeronis]TDV20660.1 EcsC family protein [Paraburkholderia caballeronis]TDV33128.1 EcsC family protein [Paraburkholderia caballeronis]
MNTELIVLDTEDAESLKAAHQLLENPGWVARASDMVGQYIESGIKGLPEKVQTLISDAVTKSVRVALDLALKTMDTEAHAVEAKPSRMSNWMHKAAAAASGAAGGAFGVYALPVELPVSTTIMMRAIADIARGEGFDLNDETTKVQCVAVLALGGKAELPLGADSKEDDQAEIGYFAIRQAMAAAITEAAGYLAKGGTDMAGTALLRLITMVAERFSVQVGEKAAAQLVPVIGAVSGAAINAAFTDHFQDQARGHFIVLRLQKKYGDEHIKREYNKLTSAAKSAEVDNLSVGATATSSGQSSIAHGLQQLATGLFASWGKVSPTPAGTPQVNATTPPEIKPN